MLFYRLLIGIILAYLPLSCFSKNIYAHANTGMFSPNVKNALPRVYVPNTQDNTVSVIDPLTYQVVDIFKTENDPEHITPSYDLKTLWVLNYLGNTIKPIDPISAKPGKSIPVTHPYNLYFTLDGKFAIVMNDVSKTFDFRDPHTMKLIQSVPISCQGLNHMDFSEDGKYSIASCEYSHRLVKLDVINRKVLGYLSIGLSNSKKPAMPQDVRLSPDGKIFYVADMMLDGVFLIEPNKFIQVGFVRTGKGTHSIYPSRDGKLLYIANRGCNLQDNCPIKGSGSITVLDITTQKIIHQWPIPGGGSPDMGNMNADGSELWISGKFDQEVYVINTQTGHTRRIPVGRLPHGLAVWPQPGRFSLGHTGIMR